MTIHWGMETTDQLICGSSAPPVQPSCRWAWQRLCIGPGVPQPVNWCWFGATMCYQYQMGLLHLEKTMVFPFLSPNLLIILSMKLYNFGGRLIPNGSIGYLQDSRRSPVYADRLHARLAVSEVKISFGNSLDGTTHSRILMVHDPLSMLGCWKAEVTRGTVNIVYICLFIYEMQWNGYINWVSNDEHIMTNHTPSLRALQFRRSPVHAPCQWTTLRARESLADSSTGESSACAALRNAKRNILRHRKKP
jgi:hypothetical protein